MKLSIVNKLKTLKKRCKEIEKLLTNPKIIADKNQLRILSKEYSKLIEIINCLQCLSKSEKDLNIVKSLMQDPEMYEIAQEEIIEINIRKKKSEEKLQKLILLKDSDDKLGCFLEIHAGTGGDEATLFAKNLFKMYNFFSEIKNWNIEIFNIHYSEKKGFKDIIVKIPNTGAYGILKFESGGHRVQRIPETESQGRTHTSTCTVAVIPEIPKKELTDINLSDLRIDTFRSSGAGGQHVNTTDSAVRVIHLPTGLIVECQDERSQHKNKAKALEVLAARLRETDKIKRQKDDSSIRKNLLGSGTRSDRIRTYNFSKGRITDHRINLTIYQLEDIMAGRLDLLINPLIQAYKEEQLSILYGKLL